ncbi:MAG: hypothetical protein WD425_14420 [Nitrospirales bacterium]
MDACLGRRGQKTGGPTTGQSSVSLGATRLEERGDPWLLAVLAPKEVAQALMKKLEDTVFKKIKPINGLPGPLNLGSRGLILLKPNRRFLEVLGLDV